MNGLETGLLKVNSAGKAVFDGFRCFSLFVSCVVSDGGDTYFGKISVMG